MTPDLSDIIRALQAALAAHGHAADPADIRRLAAEIAAHGGLEHGGPQRAAAALADDEATDLLALLLTCRAGLEEQADPALAAARRYRQADDLDARAEAAWAAGAEFAGKAAARRLSGDIDLAAAFQRRAEAVEGVAFTLEDQALALRLQARRIEAAEARRHDLIDALRGLAA